MTGKNIDDVMPDEENAKQSESFLIAGIGASAGGIQALKDFFKRVPANSGIAYVVILHLSPDHDSQLAAVLQQATAIPVHKVTAKIELQPDHIYVVSPNVSLTLKDGFIIVSPIHTVEERRAPVDIFFRTLAESHRSNAVAVVLSGTGANGSMGLKRVKEQGGAVYVQNPREAEFSEMPRNAIATDLVDAILNVEEIPAHIIAYKESLGTIEIPLDREARPEDQQQSLREIFTQLRIRTGHDFSNYKTATMLRRIQRRIHVRNEPSLAAYAAYLRDNTEETHALLKDLLISVTNFFRDKESFNFLEADTIPKLLEGKSSSDQVRIWVVGCATGEEAYSIAMLLAEHTFNVMDAPSVQIFATDIDQQAITVAREGFYTLNDAADVSPERLRRFFNKETDGYRVKRELREMILFANHNVIKDSPFSRLDMITCRNMLIYLNHTAQERVMEIMHFALKPGAYLFLGSSESVDGAADLYAMVSREHHIFQSRQATSRIGYPVPELHNIGYVAPSRKEAASLQQENHLLERISFADLHQQLLEQYAPPSLIVNQDYDILHVSDKAGIYLQIAGGEPTQNLLKLVRPELRLDLRSALYQATQHKSNVDAKNLKIQINGEDKNITVHVRPVLGAEDTARGFLLVLFEETASMPDITETLFTSSEPVARQLEEELERSKLRLRQSVEQYEVQAEELKASNEELQAMNEELRSSAEELETSKEELQSINEELRTVNQELKIKIDEISQTSNDLNNLINSTDIGTVFLDRGFRIKMFTPPARTIFNLIPADYGRPITHITNRLKDIDLVADAEVVLDKLQTVEREALTDDGQHFIMRMLPYRTSEDRIGGVVLTFINITERKRAEDALRYSEERMRLLIESAKDYAIFTLDAERRMVSWSTGAEAILKYTETEIIGELGDIIFTPEDRERGAPQIETETAAEEGSAENERWHVRKDGSRFWGSGITSPLRSSEGKLLGFVKIMRDLTASKQAEQAKFFLASIVESSQDSIVTIDFDGTITSWNKAAEELYGYSTDEVIGRSITLLTLPEDLEVLVKNIDNIKHTRKVETYDTVRMNKNGRDVNLEIVLSPVKDASGEVIAVSTIARDITLRKKAEEGLRLSEERYRIAIEAGELATWDWNLTTNKVQWNEQHFRLFGAIPLPIELEPSYFLQFIYEEDLQLVKNQLEEVSSKGGIYRAEFRIVKQNDKQTRWMTGYGQVTQYADGKPKRVTGVMYDSTERRTAQDTLQAAQNSLNTALDAAQMGVWDLDLVTGYISHSPRHDQLLGYPTWQDEWSIEKTMQYIVAEDKPKFDEAYTSMFVKGTFKLEMRVRHADGSICWMYYYGRVFKDAEGKPTHAAGVIFDITDLKSVEQRKDEFIGIASHELKTPVTTIKIYTDILHQQLLEAGNEQSLVFVERLGKQVDRLSRLIRDLLDATRLAEGKLVVNESTFDIDQLLHETIDGLQTTWSKHTIVFDLQDLPIFTGDKEKLQQVFINLLSNAIKYSPEADKILVKAFADNNINISVQDFGIGMSIETQSKLFERFFRSEDSSIATFPGIGLGLYISMQIVKQHNGNIIVQSEKGKGATFTVVLPLQQLNEVIQIPVN